MSKIDELLHEHSLHSVRSDGSQMIALATGQNQSDPEWEILVIRKDGSVENDGTLTLDTGEKTVLRKICTTEGLQTLAASRDFVEWRPGVLEEHPEEQVLLLQEQLHQTEHGLQEIQTKYEQTEKQLQEALQRVQELGKFNASQRKKERAASRFDIDELEQRLKSNAAAIAERTPSETQKIIANQVELSSGFYQEVGVQSHESFRLSLWLAVAGGAIFLLTVLATVFITLLRGDSTLITMLAQLLQD